jgi:hypothetical protein
MLVIVKQFKGRQEATALIAAGQSGDARWSVTLAVLDGAVIFALTGESISGM